MKTSEVEAEVQGSFGERCDNGNTALTSELMFLSLCIFV